MARANYGTLKETPDVMFAGTTRSRNTSMSRTEFNQVKKNVVVLISRENKSNLSFLAE